MSLRTCRDIRADLSAYLEDDLDPVLTGETRVHIESCADCRSELELLRRTVGTLRGLPDLPPPAAILAGVRARLRPEPWYRRLTDGRPWSLGVPVGALATLLIVVGISLFQSRYPDMSQTVSQESLPKAPAPPAREMPTTPPPVATGSPATRSTVADRKPAAPARSDVRAKGTLDSTPLPQDASRGEEVAAHESSAVAGADKQDRDRSAPAATVERVAPTDLKVGAVKAEQSQPSQRELRSAGLAEEKAAKATWIEVVCLFPPDGDTVDDLTRLLLREGAGNIAVSALEPPAVHEAFAPHRLRLASLPEPSQGWAVTALVPPHAINRLLDTLASRTSLRILEQPARDPAPEVPTEALDLRITVLR